MRSGHPWPTGGADDRDMGVGIEKAERGEFVEERPIEGELCGAIPVFQAHRGIQAGFLDAA